TISVAATGDATGGGVDYTLGTTLVTFAPGETSAMLPLEIVNDLLDENDEQISLQLENGINVIPEGIVTYTHTIEDDDDPPTVSFTAASSTVTEAAGMIDLEVQLSAPSGKDITVPFELGGTASNTDFNV